MQVKEAMSATATRVRKKVLVAEADRQLGEIIQALLSRHGYDVIRASDGRDALQKILAENPDAILLDDSLPGIQETQICTMLRSNKITRQIPLAFLTGDPQGNVFKPAQEAGALLLIPKPFKPEQLLSSVGILISARRKKSAA